MIYFAGPVCTAGEDCGAGLELVGKLVLFSTAFIVIAVVLLVLTTRSSIKSKRAEREEKEMSEAQNVPKAEGWHFSEEQNKNSVDNDSKANGTGAS